MRAQRICGIKALSNIKQKRGQQSKESSEAESMTSLGFLLFYLSPSIFRSLFCFHSEVVRWKTALQGTERVADSQRKKGGTRGRKGSKQAENMRKGKDTG